MISDFFEMVPESLWATIDDRPIVFLYSSSFVGAYNQSTFDYINQHFQADFGTTPYIVRETSWQGVSTDEAYSWGSAPYGPTTIGRVGTLGPGFDSTACYFAPTPSIRTAMRRVLQYGWEAMIVQELTRW
jgi:hypothetical protein